MEQKQKIQKIQTHHVAAWSVKCFTVLSNTCDLNKNRKHANSFWSFYLQSERFQSFLCFFSRRNSFILVGGVAACGATSSTRSSEMIIEQITICCFQKQNKCSCLNLWQNHFWRTASFPVSVLSSSAALHSAAVCLWLNHSVSPMSIVSACRTHMQQQAYRCTNTHKQTFRLPDYSACLSSNYLLLWEGDSWLNSPS